MEIKLYSRNDYLDCRSLTSAADRTTTSTVAVKEKRQENYDKVTIHSDFSKIMAEKHMSDSADISADRIYSLRQQIAAGTYQPDARRIAECMLERRSQFGLF